MKLTYIEDEPHASREKYEELKGAPLAEQRFKFFGGDIFPYQDISRMETDTHVYWAVTSHVPKWNKKSGVYLKNDSSMGCTYDKATKKFKWWYGKQIMFSNTDVYKDMCKYFGAEWFIEETNGLKISTTNSVFARVLKGKITNTEELINGIIKANPLLCKHDINTDKLLSYVRTTNNRIQTLADYIEVAEDIDTLLSYVCKSGSGFSWRMYDLIKYARMLNRKVDFSWSEAMITHKRNEWEKEVEVIKQEWMPLLSF
jgi:hypothetical protein